VDQVAFEQGMTLNMGQWLSIPFILIGIASVWYALSHPAVADDSKKSNPKKR
jgi:prolipoprotein diacylglyceryltransferase